MTRGVFSTAYVALLFPITTPSLGAIFPVEFALLVSSFVRRKFAFMQPLPTQMKMLANTTTPSITSGSGSSPSHIASSSSVTFSEIRTLERLKHNHAMLFILTLFFRSTCRARFTAYSALFGAHVLCAQGPAAPKFSSRHVGKAWVKLQRPSTFK